MIDRIKYLFKPMDAKTAERLSAKRIIEQIDVAIKTYVSFGFFKYNVDTYNDTVVRAVTEKYTELGYAVIYDGVKGVITISWEKV